MSTPVIKIVPMPGPSGYSGSGNGSTGPTGPQGLDGINGLSAYDLAVNNGFTGTEQEWLGSLSSNTPEISPLPSFLSYAIGRDALPILNQNFGWNSNGLYFGPTALDASGGLDSYPVFTSFAIPTSTSVHVEFDMDVQDFCSDIGMSIFLDGTVPQWQWGSNTSRIAAQFNCPGIELDGLTTMGTVGSEDLSIQGPGVYRFIFDYDPTLELDNVVFKYKLDEQVLAEISISEILPQGDYRIGFASDNDSGDGPVPGGLAIDNNRSYIRNLLITVGNTETYSDSLTNNYSGNPSTINTGAITFDGIRIIGAGRASGDGYNNGTIELVPDKDLETDQYLIIDPTVPNHIHIRSGGQQDNSNAELILGAEETHVMVSDSSGQVSIASKGTSYNFVYILNENTSELSSTLITNSSLAEPIDTNWRVANDANFPRSGSALAVVGISRNGDSYEISVTDPNFFAIETNYYFFQESYQYNYSNDWSFGSDGVFSGPAMGGLIVNAITSPTASASLPIYSNGNIDINANGGTITLGSNVAPSTVEINTYSGAIINSARTGAYADEDKIVATLGDIGNIADFVFTDGTITNNNILIESTSGDIVLSADGSTYIGSANPGNGIVTDGYLAAVIGDTSIINNSTGHTITDIISAIPTGPTGPTGPQGATGPAAVPLSGAYAVQGGTTGTQPTFNGDPLFTAYYERLDGTVHFDIQVNFSNITSFGSGQYYMTLPFPAAVPYTWRNGSLHRASNGKQYGISASVAAGQTQFMLSYTASNGQDDAFTQSSPFVLSTADSFNIAGTYRATANN